MAGREGSDGSHWGVRVQVEVVTPLEEMLQKYEEAHPGEQEVDQVEWKTFWVKVQRYRTLCSPCIARRNAKERNVAMGGIPDEELQDEANDWGPVYLSAASRAILIAWHRKARERIFGRGGQSVSRAASHAREGRDTHRHPCAANRPLHGLTLRHPHVSLCVRLTGRRRPAKPVAAEFSDEEEEDEEKPGWTKGPVHVNEATRAIAIKWLRTARARVMARAGAPDGGGAIVRSTRTATRKPGEKAPRSKQEAKSPK